MMLYDFPSTLVRIIMAQSRPIISEACGHENSEPVEVSPDAIQKLKESWGKVQQYGLPQAGAALYKR